MHQTDWELIQACRQASADAWDNVLNKYGRLVYSIALNYGLSREDAADITQLTFAILLQSLETFDDEVSLGSWLATVARRHTWRLLERQRRESTKAFEDLAENLYQEVDESSAQAMAQWEAIEWLEQGLIQLGERCRTLLLALYFDEEDLSYEAIATKLDMPVGSIGPTRARCLHRLKQLLNKL